MGRRLRNLVLLVILGVIINVAVAWAFALWGPLSSDGSERRGVAWSRLNIQLGSVPDEDGVLAQYRNVCQCGWPYRSMTGEYLQIIRTDTVSWRLVNAAAPEWFRRCYRPEFRIIPLQPLWRGFLFNSSIYAGILILLYSSPWALRQLRRWRRVDHGRCPACAYPVGSSAVCTECGRPLPLASQNAAIGTVAPRTRVRQWSVRLSLLALAGLLINAAIAFACLWWSARVQPGDLRQGIGIAERYVDPAADPTSSAMFAPTRVEIGWPALIIAFENDWFDPLPKFLGVLWHGFLANTFLYATIVWFMVIVPSVPGRVIRWHRARTNRRASASVLHTKADEPNA